MLDSALSRPRNLNAYGEDDLYELAASYGEGIARNHPFVDGNERSAFLAADLFLALNGCALRKSQGHAHAEMMEALGQGQLTRARAAAHLRAHSDAI